MADTRAKLLVGALETLRTRGIAGTSARAVAGAAGVNQALVFYHFGSMDELLVAALEHGAEEQVARYRGRFDRVTSIGGLVELSRALREDDEAERNMTVIAQLLAGGRANPRLAEATARGLELWVAELRNVLRRVLTGTPLAEFVDTDGLARALAASFLGLDLYGGVDEASARRATAALEQFAVLMSALDDLGPVVRRAVRTRLRRAGR
ncbi:Bacterial regulatory protein, tetR family [Actinomadura rubteroloni]|uniref:Bacterial regulatory protein, tetR family n=1 Tax=Actinomadura rubteroloni TaxID=1926885 RepID=A0A2P4UNF9_9ACTN|nr:TetR/AcrR family transcriptional regulator [Actinomadura rubteroloni]POM26577.1 Bacterial regulatory protein, tetR family [Actinomadura rubteroloni]